MRDGLGSSTLAASIGLVIGGALWGVLWVPLRSISEIGLDGAWPGLAMYLGTGAVLLPILVLRWRRIAAQAGGLVMCGLFTGAAFSLFSTAVLMTDVVRVLLLFYLTPIWGTLVGLALLGERLTRTRLIALAMAVTGLVVVLGADGGIPLPRGLGDWLALGAGMAWAYGTYWIYRMGSVAVPEQCVAFVFGALLVSGGSILIGGPAFGAVPTAPVMGEALLWGLLASVYVLPMLVLTIWPASVLTPGRVGLLLMSDVVVGVASAAILLPDEPFGLPEITGTVLIVGAAFVELMGRSGAPERAAEGG